MKNKLLVCAIALATLGMLGCRKDKVDVFDTNIKIAQKSLQGLYIYLDVDSVIMNTTLHEWNMTENAKDGKIGYYRIAITGCGEDSDQRVALTWEPAVMAKNQLSMTIPVKMDGKEYQMLWKDGVLVLDEYTTTKSIVSVGDIMHTLSEKFANVTFVFNDTTNYLTYNRDTIPYLAWKTEVVNFTQDSIDEYKLYLIAMADTLHWFNENFPKQAVPDTVRFSPKAQTDGTFKGLIPRAYETKYILVDTINHGPLEIINAELICNRKPAAVGLENNGSYFFHKRTWTEECYTKPTSAKALTLDSIYSVTDAKWTFDDYTNLKKFNVLMKGTIQKKVSKTEAGNPSQGEDTTTPNAFSTFPISAFSADDGVLILFDKKFSLKQ